MKKLYLSLLFIVLLSSLGYGQEQKVVRWFDPALPKECCRNWFKDGHLFTSYDDANIYYSVTLIWDFDKKYTVAWIMFANKSGKPVDIDPSTFRFTVVEPKTRELEWTPLEKVSSDIEGRGRWLMFLSALSAGMATQTSTVQTDGTIRATNGIDTVNGTYAGTSTVTTPNVQAQQQVAQQNAQRRASNEYRAAGVKEFSLKRNTLFKDDMTAGLVFFKGNPKGQGCILSFVIDGVKYEVPYGSARPK